MAKISVLERVQHQEALRKILTSGGHEFDFYTSRQEMSHAVKEDPSVDLMIADATLLVVSGISNVKEFKSIPGRYHVPLLVVAPQENISLKIASLKEGADDFMTMPLLEPELLARIDALTRVKRYVERLVEEKLHYQELSERDFHTGLPNRTYLMARLIEEVSRVGRHNELLSLMMIQIDDFHLITARYGYEAGEDLLTKMARFLRENLRKEDILGRFGGKELLIMMPHTDAAGCAITADKLRKKLETTPFFIEAGKLFITVSAAIATYNPKDTPLASPPNLLMKLDAILKEAEKQTKNHISELPLK